MGAIVSILGVPLVFVWRLLMPTKSERRLEKTGHELKEERASHKQTTSQLAGLSEDMADTRAAKEAAEKALAEKKRSSAEEKRQLESEMDEMKTQHDHQVAALQEKLRHQRSSTDTTAKQVSELEAELTKLWEGRCEQQVTTARRTLQQSLGAVQEERDALHLQVAALEQRLSTSRSSRSDTDKQVMELEQEVEEMKVWKDKYHNLRSQAQTMKQRYEQQLQETEEERDDLMSKQSTGGAPTDITVEVKKIMNSVYKNLKQEFDPQNSYEGSDIQQTILNTVKAVTLQVVESQKQKEEPVEEVIQASSAHVTGDRGNVHYGRELDRAAKGKDTMSSIASSVESMIIPQVPHGSPRMCSSHEEPVEEVIQTSSAHVTGDRGNVHYGRELDRAETGKDTMSSIASSVESMIIPQVPHGSPRMCSSHGNDTMASITDSVESMIMPQGAPETSSNPGKSSVSLMASSVESMIIPEGMAQSLGAQPKEEIIASQVAPSVNATGKPQSKKDKPPRDLTSTVEAMILPDTAHPTGDRGNVHYGAELERTVEAMIQPAAAHPTGDRGNVHYGRQLDKEAEEKGKKKDKKAGKEKCVGEEVMVASSGGQLSAAAPPSGHHGNKNAVSLEDAVEAMIQPANAPITGDRGNIHYAEELNKAAKEGGGKAVLEKSVEAMIVPSGAPITGDKGNIHYGKELDSAAKEKGKKKDKKAGKEKCIEEEVMVASSGGQLSAAAPPSGHHGNNNAVSLVDAVEAMIQPANAPITGDRGNIHYAEELNKAAKEGGGRAVLEKSVEAMIVPSGAPITGDKGNIHYGKELDSAAKEKGKKKDKKAGKEKCVEEEVMVASSGGQLSAAAPPSGHHGNKNAVSLEDAVEAMIQPANAPITGDRGNIHYAEELNKAAKEGGSKRVLEKSVEAMVVPSGAPITGDKGNIHYGKELDSTAKDSEGKGKKNEKAKDASSSKDKSKDTKKSQNAKSDKKSASLFDDDDDLLSATSKAQEKGSAVKKTSGKKEEKKKAKTATGKEDDDLKPKPPPLFGDEDEDDLDWLS